MTDEDKDDVDAMLSRFKVNMAARAIENAALEAEIRAQQDAIWEKVRKAGLLDDGTAAVDALVLRAQAAWDRGEPFLPTRFPGGPGVRNPQLPDDVWSRHEIIWADALSRVTAIGWHLHTWAVAEQGNEVVPVPVFERRNGAL